MRDFKVRTANRVHDHKTGRKCDDKKCNGDLFDSILNFGENYREGILEEAYEQAEECDLMISMGSSLRVGSAAAIFEEAAESQSKKSVIINLQKGPYDHLADLVIHGFIDDIMNKLLEKLALEIP